MAEQLKDSPGNEYPSAFIPRDASPYTTNPAVTSSSVQVRSSPVDNGLPVQRTVTLAADRTVLRSPEELLLAGATNVHPEAFIPKETPASRIHHLNSVRGDSPLSSHGGLHSHPPESCPLWEKKRKAHSC